MKAVLLDTHSWAWSLTNDPRLSVSARRALEDAESVLVSPISFFEIAQKVRLGKWPQMEPFIERLPAILSEQGGGVAELKPAICTAAGAMRWSHRDPVDRLLAATASYFTVPIVSADPVFDGVVSRIW